MEKKRSTQNNQSHHSLSKAVAPVLFALIILASFFGALIGGVNLITFFIEVIFGVADVKDMETKIQVARSVAMFIVSLPIFLVSLKHFLKNYSH